MTATSGELLLLARNEWGLVDANTAFLARWARTDTLTRTARSLRRRARNRLLEAEWAYGACDRNTLRTTYAELRTLAVEAQNLADALVRTAVQP